MHQASRTFVWCWTQVGLRSIIGTYFFVVLLVPIPVARLLRDLDVCRIVLLPGTIPSSQILAPRVSRDIPECMVCTSLGCVIFAVVLMESKPRKHAFRG